VDDTVVWVTLAWPGVEHLSVRELPDAIEADGMVVALMEGYPLRLHYRLGCNPDWTARRVEIQTWGRDGNLTLASDGAGRWTDGAGRVIEELAGCHDVDIAATPFTNTLPIRRLRLRPGESRDLRVVYVSVPALTCRIAVQRYTCLEASDAGGVYRYESGSFAADLRVDADGLVIDYSGLWRRADPCTRSGLWKRTHS